MLVAQVFTEFNSQISDVFNGLFWLTLLLFFLVSVAAAVAKAFTRDRCLRLFDGFRVSLNRNDAHIIWGDLQVYKRGLEIRYPQPHVGTNGLIKYSYLMYDRETDDVVALIRDVDALDERTTKRRERQLRRIVKLDKGVRLFRWLRNLFNQIKSAVINSLGFVAGQLTRSRSYAQRYNEALREQSEGQIKSLACVVADTISSPYEEMLEKYIGKEVILEMKLNVDGATKVVEMPGLLADYTDRYVAVFNLNQTVQESATIVAGVPVDDERMRTSFSGGTLRVTNLAEGTLIVREAAQFPNKGALRRRLNVSITAGATATVVGLTEQTVVKLQRLRGVDIVCRRQYATIRHASI